MRSHVLNWLWLCFAFFCSVKPMKAGTRVNHFADYVNFQQKDTTVKPTTSPVVITPSSAGKDTSGKQAKDTTKPATAAPVVITPNSDTTKPKKDSAAASRPDSSRTAVKSDTTKKPGSDDITF